MSNQDRKLFLQKLFDIANSNHTLSSASDLSSDLMEAMLSYGSETEDNLNCSQHIQFGLCQVNLFNKPESIYGLKVKAKDILLADVLNVVENLGVPSVVKKEFPELTSEEWDAIMRMVTLILTALQYSSVAEKSTMIE